jgi:hypothetical protein
LKPQSTTYRSDLAKGHCQTNVEATSGLAESNTSSSSNTRAPTGANGFLPKAFAGFLPKKNAKAAYDVPIDMTLSMEQFASGAKALDLVRRNWWSMLTMLKVNKESLQASHAGLEGATGEPLSTARNDVEVPHLARRNGIQTATMSCGQLGEKPHFWKDGAAKESPIGCVFFVLPIVLAVTQLR